MKEKLNKFMENLKKQNPNANWANLLTGVAVLVMVAVFSYAYFTKSRTENMVIDDEKLVKQVIGGENNADKTSGKETEDVTRKEGETVEPSDGSAQTPIQPESGEKGAEPASGTTVVQKGEGLWHVAQRVCGDGEKYNILAAANGLSVWEELNEGMTLKVVCK